MISPCCVLTFGSESFDSFLKGKLLCKQRFFSLHRTSNGKLLLEVKQNSMDSHIDFLT